MSVSQLPQDRALRWIAAITGLLGILPTINALLSFHPAFLAVLNVNVKTLAAITFTIETVVIIVLICCMPQLPRMAETASTRVPITSSRQFMMFWYALWISWFVYYVVKTILLWLAINLRVAEYPFVGTTANTLTHLGLDLLFLLSTAFLLLCYLTMSMRTVSRGHPDLGMFQISAIVLFAFAGLVVLEGIFQFANSPGARFFDALYGLISGVVLALFVGRLESKFIDLPRSVVTLLYTYAVIQLSYPVLQTGFLTASDADLASILVISLALIFKVILFWSVRGAIVTRTLTYYMLEYRRLYDLGAAERTACIREVLMPTAPESAAAPT